jgi:hypothetical protein
VWGRALNKRTGGTLHPFRARTGLKKGNAVDQVIGRQIKSFRLVRDIAPDRIAVSLGLVPDDYDRLESGDLRAGPELILLISKILDVPVTELFSSGTAKYLDAD